MKETDNSIDWSSTTYDGSRREQMRRAAEIPFDRILDAIEEMGELAAELAAQASAGRSVTPGSPVPDLLGKREELSGRAESLGVSEDMITRDREVD